MGVASMKQENYKYSVEKGGEYEYIRSFRVGESLPNGKVAKLHCLQIKHKYCGNTHEIRRGKPIDIGYKCPRCCGGYEKSFAHHIEVVLGESLDKYWDFEKNAVNPYHIYKNHTKCKVWIKCQEKDYHDSYEVSCDSFIGGGRCSYCKGTDKVHPKDSFAQYHIDNTDSDFLMKYWSDKNTLDPFAIAPSSNKHKVWILCQDEDYHNDKGGYDIACHNFTKGKRCSYCNPKHKHQKVHLYDSFGYKHFDKVCMNWHEDNEISPFSISCGSNKKYKFICHECNHEWYGCIKRMSKYYACPNCEESSRGEKEISSNLKLMKVDFYKEKQYNGLQGLYGRNLRYDFYLPDYNLLIEYQGEQHRRYCPGVHKTYKDFERQKEYDRRKYDYANKKGIKLLEIWHWQYSCIKDILIYVLENINKLEWNEIVACIEEK